jgi:uncharacterized protein with GYD domain
MHIPHRQAKECDMKIHSLVFVSALATVLAVPAMAQGSMNRYVLFFKYGDNAVKAMTENPQDRAAQGAKITESFGGKQDSIYFFPSGGEFDGMAIDEFPDGITAEGVALFLRATGNFPKIQVMPLMNAEEFKTSMEKAKNVKSTYTPPTATKQ